VLVRHRADRREHGDPHEQEPEREGVGEGEAGVSCERRF
jgi:hypothetical protein